MFSTLDAGRELVEATTTTAGVGPSEGVKSEGRGVITLMGAEDPKQ